MSEQEQTKQAETPAITALTVAGYKSIADETTIEIRPLTLLAGANSSGKSSIMQPFLLLKQTIEGQYPSGILSLYGKNLQLTSPSQLLSRFPNKKADSISIGICMENKDCTTSVFELTSNQFMLIQNIYHSQNKIYSLSTKPSKESLEELTRQLIEGNDFFQNPRISWVMKYSGIFLSLEGALGQLGMIQFPFSPPIHARKNLQKLIHIPGLREKPKDQHALLSYEQAFPGTFEDYVPTILRDWESKNEWDLYRLVQHLKDLGLTDNVVTKQLNETEIEILVGQTLNNQTLNKSNDLVNIADVGLGVSQVLPVLVGLLVARPGQMVYVEQPEIHLHPRAQVALGNVLAEAAQRGVRVVVETHSRLLLQSIQSLVAEQTLDPALVKMHWFQRGEDGRTQVNSTDLDEKGAFGNWPIDFDDIELQQQRRYIEAVEQLMWGVHA